MVRGGEWTESGGQVTKGTVAVGGTRAGKGRLQVGLQSLPDGVLVKVGALAIECVPKDDHRVKEQVLGRGAGRKR